MGISLSFLNQLTSYSIFLKRNKIIIHQFVNDLQQVLEEDQWTLYVDGYSDQKREEVKIVLEGSNQILIEKSLHFTFKTSNIKADYEAI